MTASWQVYHSDWQGQQFARLVSTDISAITQLNWTNVGNLGAPVGGMNEMPEHVKVRSVHLIDGTGRRIKLPISSNDAPVYSMGGTPPQLTYKGVVMTITGFSGERRSIPR
jgi:hypothetical protein